MESLRSDRRSSAWPTPTSTTAAALDPVWATDAGVAGHDDRLTDYSPDGIEARAALCRQTLVDLAALATPDPLEQLAASLLVERLDTQLALHRRRRAAPRAQQHRQPGAGHPRRVRPDGLRHGGRLGGGRAAPGRRCPTRWPASSPPTRRVGATVSPRPGARRWRRPTRPRRGPATGPTSPSSTTWSARPARSTASPRHCQGELAASAAAATEAYAGLADLPARHLRARRHRVRRRRGRRATQALARAFLGAEIDLAEAYEWGWEELGRIETDMVGECGRLRPGATIAETVDWLEHDSDLAVEGTDALRQWLQDLMDQAVADLNGTYFDIAPPVRTVEAMIAPPGGAAAMYYTGPSEDFSRPGRTWYPPPPRPDPLPAVDRDEHRLPRRRPRPSPAGGPGRAPAGPAVALRPHDLHLGPRRGLGPVRRAPDGRVRLPGPTRVPDGHAGRPGHAGRAGDPRHRHAPRAGDPDPPARTRAGLRARASAGPPTWVASSCACGRATPSRSWPASWCATWAGRARPSATRSASGSGSTARAEARARHGADFDLKAFHAYALDLGPLGLDQLRASWHAPDGIPDAHG